jgi:hypothetical protein
VHYLMLGRSQSGVPITARWVHVFDFRDGRIFRTRNFNSLDAAVKAIGDLRLIRVWSPGEE